MFWIKTKSWDVFVCLTGSGHTPTPSFIQLSICSFNKYTLSICDELDTVLGAGMANTDKHLCCFGPIEVIVKLSDSGNSLPGLGLSLTALWLSDMSYVT